MRLKMRLPRDMRGGFDIGDDRRHVGLGRGVRSGVGYE